MSSAECAAAERAQGTESPARRADAVAAVSDAPSGGPVASTRADGQDTSELPARPVDALDESPRCLCRPASLCVSLLLVLSTSAPIGTPRSTGCTVRSWISASWSHVNSRMSPPVKEPLLSFQVHRIRPPPSHASPSTSFPSRKTDGGNRYLSTLPMYFPKALHEAVPL